MKPGRPRKLWFAGTAMGAVAIIAASCFDRGDRWLETTSAPPPPCHVGDVRCADALLQSCQMKGSSTAWVTSDDCGQRGQVCAPSLLACANCNPATYSCDGQNVVLCSDDGTTQTTTSTCNPGIAEACRAGQCQNLCNQAQAEKSNVGCEYWAVDLDNAVISATENAAAQQYAVAVSNPQPDVPVHVHVYQDDTSPGTPGSPYEVASATIAPLNLEVFKLGPREVDGSPQGQFNAGTNTALTRHAYKVTTDFPVVVFQFNPLDNVNVFSNDASLLYPREALDYGSAPTLSYVVLGWPQTIAATDNPDTNFDPLNPINLRAYLAIVGTQPGTHVRVTTAADVVAGGPVGKTAKGGIIEQTLDPFDVLNLETGDFNEDFTGSLIEADGPVAVFSGSEASDAPHFQKLSDRLCCADHLEGQLAPIRTAGKTFAVPHTPSRTRAVNKAGASIQEVKEPDYVRIIATRTDGADITTTLPAPDNHFHLAGLGSFQEVRAFTDFMATSDQPVLVERIMASQDACGVPRGLPGGDPSMMMWPPLEQARTDYVFFTPDKYVFNFASIVAPATATVELDGQMVGPNICEVAPADGLTDQQRGTPPKYVVYRCQISFPIIDPTVNPPKVDPGVKNDGVHHVASNYPVLVAVLGFDSYVSYEYAGGTELKEIAPPQ